MKSWGNFGIFVIILFSLTIFFGWRQNISAFHEEGHFPESSIGCGIPGTSCCLPVGGEAPCNVNILDERGRSLICCQPGSNVCAYECSGSGGGGDDEDDGGGGGGGGSCGDGVINIGEQCEVGIPGDCQSPGTQCNLSNCRCGDTPPSCSINSFTADNITPSSGSGTTLRFSLNGSFPWSISLLIGTNPPSPLSGTGSSGTSATGNLTGAHAYRLSCGSNTRDVTVIPGGQCIPNGSCSAPDPACEQTTTGTDNCDNSCSKVGGSCSSPPGTVRISCNGLYSSCSIIRGQSVTLRASWESSTRCVGREPNGVASWTWGASGWNDLSGSNIETVSPVVRSKYGVDCEDAGSTTVVPIWNHAEVWVNLTPPSTRYSVNVNPVYAGGIVKSNDNKVNCGTICSAIYNRGESTTLKATPRSSYWKFAGWSGDCSGTGDCVLNNINSDKTISGRFTPRKFEYKEF